MMTMMKIPEFSDKDMSGEEFDDTLTLVTLLNKVSGLEKLYGKMNKGDRVEAIKDLQATQDMLRGYCRVEWE